MKSSFLIIYPIVNDSYQFIFGIIKFFSLSPTCWRNTNIGEKPRVKFGKTMVMAKRRLDSGNREMKQETLVRLQFGIDRVITLSVTRFLGSRGESNLFAVLVWSIWRWKVRSVHGLGDILTYKQLKQTI